MSKITEMFKRFVNQFDMPNIWIGEFDDDDYNEEEDKSNTTNNSVYTVMGYDWEDAYALGVYTNVESLKEGLKKAIEEDNNNVKLIGVFKGELNTHWTDSNLEEVFKIDPISEISNYHFSPIEGKYWLLNHTSNRYESLCLKPPSKDEVVTVECIGKTVTNIQLNLEFNYV